MKRHTIKSLVASMAVALCGIPAGVNAGPTASPASAKGSDCHSIAASLRKAVKANPSQVMIYVEDAIIANGACACEIVKAAILGSGANAGTAEANAIVKQIVITAITTNPSMASIIVECAMAVAPGAASEIQAALSEALGEGKGAAGGGSDFGGGASADVRGIYLVPPLASGSLLVESVATETETIIRRERTVIRRIVPAPPVSPSSGS